MISFKSALTPEGSIMAGVATVALVVGIYQFEVGSVTEVHLTDANAAPVTTGLKKAGSLALASVAGVALLARDPNIMILGGAAIMLTHAHYRHAHLVNPNTGRVEGPGPAAYQPAQYAVSPQLQAVPG